MKLPSLAVMMLLFFPLATQAQNRHLAKPWTWMKSNMSDSDYQRWVEPRRKDRFYKDRYFWMGTAIIAAAITADAYSTSIPKAPSVYETSPLLGRHPGNARIAGFSSAYFAGQFGLHALAWKESHRDPSQTWRQIGRWGLPTGLAIVHGTAAANNFGLPRKQ